MRISEFNISSDTFLGKVSRDLGAGVKVISKVERGVEVVKVWTDSPQWQFSILGVVVLNDSKSVNKFEIESFGTSLQYMRMKAEVLETDVDLNIDKMGTSFAQMGAVDSEEAQNFLDAYMQSTFNRTLTDELFEEYVHDEDYFNWLIY